MDSNARENSDSKAEFKKPSNDAANRKYRRRSPVGGGVSSASSDGSPLREERSSSPVPSKKDVTKIADDKRKRDDGRNPTGRSGESYKQSDRQSSRSYYRHDDHSRRDSHVDEYDRGYSKSSYRSGRDSRDTNKLDRSRDYVNDVDTYAHAKSDGSGHRSRGKDSYDRVGSGRRHEERDRDRARDEKGDRYVRTDYRKSSADHKGDRSLAYEESKAQRNDSSSRKDNSGHRLKELSLKDSKEVDANDDKNRETKDESNETSVKDQDSVSKKPKVFSLDSTGSGLDGTSKQAYVTDSDIDAAKIAAMKAAELVNKNLVGTGYMSTDQKKKLLWGNKKNTATEESAHRWDSTTFGDRERQEKFYKLMGAKGDTKVENKIDNPDVEKQREQLQMELERQYTAGLRRRDGRTVGLGL